MAAHPLLLANQNPASVLHRDRPLNCILNHIQWQSGVKDRRGRRRRDCIALRNLLSEGREKMWLVCDPEQIIRSLGFATKMGFLSSAKHHDLIEADRLRMFESKDGEPIKLAG